MAKISSQEAVAAIGNRYDLVLVGARRARELRSGWQPMIDTDNDVCVTALKEIELKKIGKEYLLKNPSIGRKERPDQN
jgi:DNA-directed RNA polymerase subunit omega